MVTFNNNNIYLKSNTNVYKHTSSVDCTQNVMYNLKQYDHCKIQILNDFVHITTFLT